VDVRRRPHTAHRRTTPATKRRRRAACRRVGVQPGRAGATNPSGAVARVSRYAPLAIRTVDVTMCYMGAIRRRSTTLQNFATRARCPTLRPSVCLSFSLSLPLCQAWPLSLPVCLHATVSIRPGTGARVRDEFYDRTKPSKASISPIGGRYGEFS